MAIFLNDHLMLKLLFSTLKQSFSNKFNCLHSLDRDERYFLLAAQIQVDPTSFCWNGY